MNLNKESLRTISVALVMCLVCSVLVSVVVVILKPEQKINKILDMNKNILMVSGLYNPDMSDKEIMAEFNHFDVKVVDLTTGKYATPEALKKAGINVETYNQYAAAKNTALSTSLSGDDPAGIGRLPRFVKIYVMEDKGVPQIVVLPVSGYGLWSMMYGFIALGADLNTIKGFGFYQQGETPGLGGEVDNPKWKALWPGKKVYNTSGHTALDVVKGKARNDEQIDGLSGATLTTRGVNNLIHFWSGNRGFKTFLVNLKKGEA